MPLTYTSISFFQFLQCCLHVRIVFTKNVNIYRVHVLLPLVSTAASCCSTFWHACCVFGHRNMPFNCSSEATRVAKSKIAANVSLTDRSDLLHMTLSVFSLLNLSPKLVRTVSGLCRPLFAPFFSATRSWTADKIRPAIGASSVTRLVDEETFSEV